MPAKQINWIYNWNILIFFFSIIFAIIKELSDLIYDKNSIEPCYALLYESAIYIGRSLN